MLTTEVKAVVDEAISEQVKTGLEGYSETITTAQTQAVARVHKTFEELASIYLDGPPGEMSLPELAEAKRRKERLLGRPGG